MYKFDIFDELRKNDFLFFLNNKGIVPSLVDNKLVVSFNDNIIFEKNYNELDISDLNNILGISLVDSKYVYYFTSIAYDNIIEKQKTKKKSL